MKHPGEPERLDVHGERLPFFTHPAAKSGNAERDVARPAPVRQPPEIPEGETVPGERAVEVRAGGRDIAQQARLFGHTDPAVEPFIESKGSKDLFLRRAEVVAYDRGSPRGERTVSPHLFRR